jgi:hypothetical protein
VFPVPFIREVAFLVVVLTLAGAVISPAIERQQDYLLKIQGENVGTCRMNLRETKEGLELLYTLSISFLRMGQQLDFHIDYDIIADDRFGLKNFTYSSNISGKERKLSGVVVGNTFVLEEGGSQSVYDWSSDYILEPMTYLCLARGGLQPGQTAELAVFDPESSSLTKLQLKVVEQTGEGFGISSSDGQLVTNAVVDADGWLAEEAFDFGGMVITVAPASGQEEVKPGDIDMILSFRIPLAGEYNPDAQEVDYRLTFSEEHPLSLKSDFRQQIISVSPGEIELTVGSDSSGSLTTEEKDSLLYPGAPYCAGDQQIAMLAEEISKKEPGDEIAKAQKLSDWVKTNIASTDYSQVFGDALMVLERKNGDCTEHSTLLVGLLRAQGIPSRAVVGVVYMQGYFYYHMWVEANITDRWISLDPTLGYMDPYHIKLAEVSPRGQFTYDELLKLINSLSMGKLSITVLSSK